MSERVFCLVCSPFTVPDVDGVRGPVAPGERSGCKLEIAQAERERRRESGAKGLSVETAAHVNAREQRQGVQLAATEVVAWSRCSRAGNGRRSSVPARTAWSPVKRLLPWGSIVCFQPFDDTICALREVVPETGGRPGL